jgi:hypothetical protein
MSTPPTLLAALLSAILRRAGFPPDKPVSRDSLIGLARNNHFTSYDCASILQLPFSETCFLIRDCLDKHYLTEIHPYRARTGISASRTGLLILSHSGVCLAATTLWPGYTLPRSSSSEDLDDDDT